MPTPTDVQSAEQAARRLLDARRDEKIMSIRALATARQAKNDTLAAAEQAERADTAAWATALKQGWSEADLREVGYDAPTRRTPGRPRRRAAAADRARTASASNGAPPQRDAAPDDAGADPETASPLSAGNAGE